jgi:hypothetical protein
MTTIMSILQEHKLVVVLYHCCGTDNDDNLVIINFNIIDFLIDLTHLSRKDARLMDNVYLNSTYYRYYYYHHHYLYMFIYHQSNHHTTLYNVFNQDDGNTESTSMYLTRMMVVPIILVKYIDVDTVLPSS